MTTTKTVNYTEAQTAEIVTAYKAGETVEAIAERVGKSVRSVVAKLSREGAYVAKSKAHASRAVTKAALLELVEDLMQLERGTLESLAKADKAALEALAGAVTTHFN